MLPSVPEESGDSGRGLAPTARRRRARGRFLIARDAAAASAGSAAVGLAVSLGAHSTLIGVITGGAVWIASSAAVALTAWLRAFRRAGSPQIDPWALPEPWRGIVRDSVNAGRRFEVATASLSAGPLRDHVASLEPVVAQQVRAVWESAQRGALLTGGFPPGTHVESAQSLSAQLRSLQEERASISEGSRDRLAALDQAEATVAARLRQAKRAESVAAWLQDGLRSVTARLDAAVTSLVELGAQTPDGALLDVLGSSIDSIGSELSALQAGLREVSASLPPVKGPFGEGLPVKRARP